MLAAPPAPAKRLLDFIAEREAPHGYDTVYANRQKQMPKPVTTCTVDELIAQGPWRTKAFGSSACGRYQFMAATLANLKRALGLTGSEVMTPAFQDALGFKLLRDRGYDRFMALAINVPAFGLAIAKEWASFPVLATVQGQKRTVARGQSFYAGDGKNKSLVSPDAVEAILKAIRVKRAAELVYRSADQIEPAMREVVAEAGPTPAPLTAPRVVTVPGPPVTKVSLLGRLFGRKPPTAPEHLRPGLKPSGDGKLWDVQSELKRRAYYTKGFLDGLDGPLMQEAVAQARKDNGLGDGGIDAAFLDALPGFPQRPVSAERANLSLAKAAAARPDLFDPVKLLGSAGALLSVGGAVDGSGLLDTLQKSASQVSDVAGSVQSAFGVVASVVTFAVEHRWLVLLAIGVVLLFKAASYGLDFVAKVRAAFL